MFTYEIFSHFRYGLERQPGIIAVLKRKKPLLRRSSLKQSRLRRAKTATDTTSPEADASDKLWSILRDREVAGLRFRHHERVGPYVVDFLCPAARVIILVEGTTPIDPMQTSWLREHGYRVLQIPQAEVRSEFVLDAIAQMFAIHAVPEIRSANFDPPSRGE